MISIKHLRYFAALARQLHFGRAAEACAISQPALSLQMKELEEILGAPLIERASRKVALTPLGETFALRAEVILREINELAELARATRGIFTGALRIGMIPTVAPYLLPAVITRLKLDLPHADLYPREAVTTTLIEELNSGKLDAAIVALPISEPSLYEFPLFEEEFMLVRPKADGERPIPAPAQLREMRLLLLEEGHCFRQQALDYCTPGQNTPRDLMEGSSLSTLVQMVGVGIGVTLIPQMAVAHEASVAQVAVTRLDHPRPYRKVGMVWRNSNPLGDHLRFVARSIRDEYKRVLARQSAGTAPNEDEGPR